MDGAGCGTALGDTSESINIYDQNVADKTKDTGQGLIEKTRDENGFRYEASQVGSIADGGKVYNGASKTSEKLRTTEVPWLWDIKYRYGAKPSYRVSKVEILHQVPTSTSNKKLKWDKSNTIKLTKASDIAAGSTFDGTQSNVSNGFRTNTDSRIIVTTAKVAPASATILIKKNLEGRDVKDKEFSFEVYEGKNKVSVANNTDDDGTAVTTARATIPYDYPGTDPGEVAGTKGYYTKIDANTYRRIHTYTVKEVKGNLDRVTYDTSSQTVVVWEDYNPNTGKLTATVKSGTVVFNNTFTRQCGVKVAKSNTAKTKGIEGAVFSVYKCAWPTSGTAEARYNAVKTNATLVKTMTSGSNGWASLAKTTFPCDNSTYTIIETTPPSGYKLNKDWHFTFKAAKTLTDGTIVSAGKDPDNGNGGYCTNEWKTCGVKIKKTKSDGTTGINGAKFTIYEGDWSDWDTVKAGTGLKTLESGNGFSKGVVQFNGIKCDGTKYTIIETVPPAGYKPNKTWHCTFTAAKSLDDGTIGDKTVTNPCKNTPKTCGVKVKKTKPDGTTGLKGATFSIYKGKWTDYNSDYDTITSSNNNKNLVKTVGTSGTFKSNKQGIAELENTSLNCDGTWYTIVETVSPSGYELNKSWHCTFQASTDTANGHTFDGTIKSGTNGGPCIDTAKQCGVKVKKVDSSGNPLNGAKFTVYEGGWSDYDTVAAGTVAYGPFESTGTGTNKGIAQTPNNALDCVNAKYTVIETTPAEGYRLNTTWHYTFTAKKSLDDKTIVNGTGDGSATADCPVGTPCKDFWKKCGVKVKKVAPGSNTTGLEGATFSIYECNWPTGSDTAENKYNTVKNSGTLMTSVGSNGTFKSNNQGIAKLAGTSLNCDNTTWYTIIETEAPNGCTINKDWHCTFKVPKTTGDGTILDKTSQVCSDTWKKCGVKVKKTTASGTALAGATFSVYKCDWTNYNTVTTKTHVTDLPQSGSNGIAQLAGTSLDCDGSTYTIIETGAAPGCNLNTTWHYTFTAAKNTANGHIFDGTTASGDNGGPCKDTWKTCGVKVKKTTTSGTALAGATFSIYKMAWPASSDSTETKYDIVKASTGKLVKSVGNNGTFVSGTNGIAQLDGTSLPCDGAIYTIIETVAPSGYGVNKKWHYTFTAEKTSSNGKIFDGTIAAGTNGGPCKDTGKTCGVKVKKTNSSGTALSDATFSIYKCDWSDWNTVSSNNSALVITAGDEGQFYSNTNGIAQLDGTSLECDGSKYTVIETEAPAGCKINKSWHYTFTAAKSTADKTVFDGTGKVCKDSPTTFGVSVKKVSAADSTTPVEGAVFKVVKASNDTSRAQLEVMPGKRMTTGANGVAQLGGTTFTNDGTQTQYYQVIEISAPTGYQVNTDYRGYFKVDPAAADLTIYSVKDSTTNTVKNVTNTPTGTVKVKKVDANSTSMSLNGATFTVYQHAATANIGSRTAAMDKTGGAVEIGTMITTGGIATMTLPANCSATNKQYAVVETGAPGGYELNTEWFQTFTLNGVNATASFTTAAEGWCTDTPKTGVASLKAKKTKMGTTTSLQAGAYTFELRNGSGQLQTATNDANGLVQFADIEYSSSDIGKVYTYVMRELPGSNENTTYASNWWQVDVSVFGSYSDTTRTTIMYTEHASTDSYPTTWVKSYKSNVTAPSSPPSGTLTIRYHSNGADEDLASASTDLTGVMKTSEWQFDSTAPSVDGGPNYSKAGTWTLVKEGYRPTGFWLVDSPSSTIKIHEDQLLANASEVAAWVGKNPSSGSTSVDLYAEWIPVDRPFTYSAWESTRSSSPSRYPQGNEHNARLMPDFVNKVAIPQSTTLKVKKELENAELEEGQFTFELLHGNTQTPIATATNAADGTVEFPPLTFDEDDWNKQYTYVIREVQGNAPRMTYSGEWWQVEVGVSNAKLQTFVTTEYVHKASSDSYPAQWERNLLPNLSAPAVPPQGVFTVRYHANGATYDFVADAAVTDDLLDAGPTYTDSYAWSVVLQNGVYDYAKKGTWALTKPNCRPTGYWLVGSADSQIKLNEAQVASSASELAAMIGITPSGNKTVDLYAEWIPIDEPYENTYWETWSTALDGTHPDGAADIATITNVYEPEIEANLSIQKRLEKVVGQTSEEVAVPEGKFTFELLNYNGTQVIDTATNDYEGLASFDPIIYGREAYGREYHYVIREVTGTEPNYTYSDKWWQADVSVFPSSMTTLYFDQSVLYTEHDANDPYPSSEYTPIRQEIDTTGVNLEDRITIRYHTNGAESDANTGETFTGDTILRTDIHKYSVVYRYGLADYSAVGSFALVREGYRPTGYWLVGSPDSNLKIHEGDTSVALFSDLGAAMGLPIQNGDTEVDLYAEWIPLNQPYDCSYGISTKDDTPTRFPAGSLYTGTLTNSFISSRYGAKIKKIAERNGSVSEVPLQGAKFKLTGSENDPEAKIYDANENELSSVEMISGADGYASTESIVPVPANSGSSTQVTQVYLLYGRTYTITEIEAPEDYILSPEPRDFTVTGISNGQVYDIGTFENREYPSGVKLVKLDSRTGDPLQGTVFEFSTVSADAYIYDPNDNGAKKTRTTVTTDKNGIAAIEAVTKEKGPLPSEPLSSLGDGTYNVYLATSGSIPYPAPRLRACKSTMETEP